eukprot:211880_1
MAEGNPKTMHVTQQCTQRSKPSSDNARNAPMSTTQPQSNHHPAMSQQQHADHTAAAWNQYTNIQLQKVGFFTKVRWLLWKNWKTNTSPATRVKYILKTVGFPLFFLLCWIMTINSQIQAPVDPFATTNHQIPATPVDRPKQLPVGTGGLIVIIPGDTCDGNSPSYNRFIRDRLKQSMRFTNATIDTSYDTVEEMNGFIKTNQDDKILAAIIFDNPKMDFDDVSNVQYSIKLLEGNLPDFYANAHGLEEVPTVSSRHRKTESQLSNEAWVKVYTRLKLWVDDMIYDEIKGIIHPALPEDAVGGSVYRKDDLIMRPEPKTFGGLRTDWLQWTHVFFPHFYLMSFVLFVSFIKSIMTEKQTQLKQSLQIYGINAGEYWCSWMIWFLLEMAFTVICMVLYFVIPQCLNPAFSASNLAIVVILIVLFAFNLVALVCFLSTMFDDSKICQSVCGLLFCAAMVPVLPIPFVKMGLTSTHKFIFSAFGPCAFLFGLETLCDLEYLGKGALFSNMKETIYGYSIYHSILFLCLDTIIYVILTIYLDNVFPSKYRARKSLLYFVGCSNKRMKTENNSESLSAITGANFEQMEEHKGKRPAISVRNLVKSFPGVTAVNNLCFDIYEGEVYGLLGHNGAGKTTTLNILSGLDVMDSGDVLIKGRNLETEFSEIRKEYGFCPQHDILWDNLSIADTVKIIGSLKGIPSADIDEQVKLALQLVGLYPRMNAPTKILFLDEPTAGMDTEARRHVWDLINRIKKGKTIILCSHLMDEVELLCATIGIMSSGQMQCSGSSPFLKQKYGVGYSLSFNVDERIDPNTVLNKVEALISSVIPPNESVFEGIFGQEIVFKFPTQCSSKFAPLFRMVEANLDSLHILHYGIGNTTLEDVFIKAAQHGQNDTQQTQPIATFTNATQNEVNRDVKAEEFDAAFDGGHTQPNMLMTQIHCICAVVFKRLMMNFRNPSAFIASYLWPAVFLAIGCIFYDYLQANHFPEVVVGYDPNMNQALSAHQQHHDALNQLWNRANMQQQFGPLNPFNAHATNIISYDPRAWQGAPAAVDIHSHLMIKLLLSADHPQRSNKFKITTRVGQLVLSPTRLERSSDTAGRMVFTVFALIAFFVLTWTIADATCLEMPVKTHQFICGMSIVGYHVGNLLLDVVIPGLFVIASAYACVIQNDMKFLTLQNHADIICYSLVEPIMLCIISTAGFVYILACFTSRSGLLRWAPLIAIFVAQIVVTVLWFVLLPFLARGLMTLETASIIALVLTIFFALVNPFIPMSVLSLCFIFAEDLHVDEFIIPAAIKYSRYALWSCAVLYPLIAILIDYAAITLFNRCAEQRKSDDENDDVSKERVGVFDDYNGDKKYYAHHVLGLSKSFAALDAVRNVSFGIRSNEIFGFLGTNGAGKSTLLRMLMGIHRATRGRAYIDGISISNQLAIRRRIGYCPQNNLLFDKLSVDDHLRFYGMIGGIFGSKQKQFLLRELELSKYCAASASTLSGGNQRKLCCAIAMIGAPCLVLLDEPTAGVDPAARRHIWSFIQLISSRRKTAVVLTTHSMEECEALAHRITIMVDGALKCCGSKQFIKKKYSNGAHLLTLNSKNLQFNQPICDILGAKYEAKCVEIKNKRLTFQIRFESLAALFDYLEKMKKDWIHDYVVKPTDLESIFLQFARQAERNKMQ